MLRGGKPGPLPDALGLVLVHAAARCNRAAADKGQAALFEDFLKLAALAKLAVEDWKDDVGGALEAGKVGR